MRPGEKMAKALALLGASLKSVPRRLGFASNRGAVGGYPTFLGTNGADFGSNAVGDYNQLVGDPLTNSVVARCVEAISTALPDAPAYLERREGIEWQRIDDHEVLDLLRNPNPLHSEAELWNQVVAREATRGEAFWHVAYGGSRPAELWPLDRAEPVGDATMPITKYIVMTEAGRQVPVASEEIVHFRYMLNVNDVRRGWTPLSTGYRQIAGDNAAASYHSAILRNSGVLSLLIAVKESAGTGQVSPEQVGSFVTQLQRKLFGGGAGGIAGLNLPLDVHRMSYSPDEMALDRLIAYYETRICILLGVDPMVAGVGSGTQQKTYANLSEALNDFWERRIVPMRNRHAQTLTSQLLPAFGLNPSQWRLCFDYSGVAALQENKDGLHARIREDYRAGIIDLWTAQTERGMQPAEEYREVFSGKESWVRPENTAVVERTDDDGESGTELEIASTRGSAKILVGGELEPSVLGLKSQEEIRSALSLASREMRALLMAEVEEP